MGARETSSAAASPIAALIDSQISPEASHPRGEKFILIQERIAQPAAEDAAAGFERSAISFLVEHREALGIKSVWRIKNARVDAVIELSDGRRLAVEIKFRMNWEKACQACAQIGWFRTRGHEIDGGLVIFEEFTTDWAREKVSWQLEAGWSYFYGDHQRVEGVRVDLLRLRHRSLESFIDALAAARVEPGHRPAPAPTAHVAPNPIAPDPAATSSFLALLTFPWAW